MRISLNSHINPNFASHPVVNNSGKTSVPYSCIDADSSALGPCISHQLTVPSKNGRTTDLNALFNELRGILFKKDLYSDTDKFSRYFEKKLKKMMKEPTENSVIKDIFEVAAVTKSDECFVAGIMSEMTSFASWNSLDYLEKSMSNAGCGKPYDIFHNNKTDSKDFSVCEKEGYLTVNDVLHYITDNKRLISVDESASPCLYIDDNQLAEIERVKEDMPGVFDKLSEKISDGSVKLAIISGWNAKVDNKNVAQTFLGSSQDLKSSAISVINEMKDTGKSLNQVLNGESISRLKNLFGNDVPYCILRKPGAREYTPEGIKKNLSSRYPNSSQIKAVINTIADNSPYSTLFRDKICRLTAKYFDDMTVCFSEKTISEEMKYRHSAISQIVKRQGKSADDVVYIVPKKGKSFELMTYQYAKVNGIDPSKICYFNGLEPVMKQFGKNTPDLSGKTLIILDDIIGTGVSMVGSSFKYDNFAKSGFKDCNVIFSSLAALPDGVDRIIVKKHSNGRSDDFILPGKVTDYKKFLDNSGITSSSDIMFFEKAVGGSGYNSGWASVAFPYMLPDNNSNAAGLMLSYCLHNNNGYSNKSRVLYKKYIDEVNKKAEQYDAEVRDKQ